MKFNSISIEQFKSKGLLSATSYRNDLIITNRIEALDPFKHPCRLNAISVIVCTGGVLNCTVNLKEYRIEKDSVLVVFSGDIVCINSADDVVAYAIMISEQYLNNQKIDFKKRAETFINVRNNAIFSLPHETLITLQPYYLLFKSSIENETTETSEILNGLVTAFSHTIISLIRQMNNAHAQSTDVPRCQRIFDKFITLLISHHCAERSVRFYADGLHVSPKYLSFAVKEYSGKAALEWINEYVMLEAKMMLQNHDISIKEIAYSLNFITQSAFGKYFKQQLGIGPKEYRNSVKQ